ncbi:MAG: hypothetical protein HYY06_09025 [Deltaproteobacteria bacterium]|nr:hypothetical protein [Deltaproteobacteria bacterium]
MAQRRNGRTVKVSVSLDKEDLASLKRIARDSYGGNLSSAFAEAARWIRQREARRRLVELLGGPTLTPKSAASIGAELDGEVQTARKARRSRAA